MTPITRPYWLTVATTTDLAVSGVCVEPWQAKPLMDMFQAHTEALDKKEVMLSGWSFRHVREPVMTAWKLCEKLGLPAMSDLSQQANLLDRMSKAQEQPCPWQWSSVMKDIRTSCVIPFSACLLIAREDTDTFAKFTRDLILEVSKDASGFDAFGALVVREQQIDFLDPLSAIEKLRERLQRSASKPLDFTRFDECKASIEQWKIDHETPSAPAVCDPVRF
jgi:hypothetical protein